MEVHSGARRLIKVCLGHYSHYTKLCRIILLMCYIQNVAYNEILLLWKLEIIAENFNIVSVVVRPMPGIAQSV
jgi:hypothetical protein